MRIDLLLGLLPHGEDHDYLASFSILVRIDLLLGPCWRCAWRPATFCFSILVRIDLLLGARRTTSLQLGFHVSVSSCGSTYCWGHTAIQRQQGAVMFQYPRADRLIVGGGLQKPLRRSHRRFSILVRIDLLLGENSQPATGSVTTFQYPRADRLIVGLALARNNDPFFWFQYPRADRLIVGAPPKCCTTAAASSFSILVRIDLLLGDLGAADPGVECVVFQYPRADRLIVGGLAFDAAHVGLQVSVSSCGSTYCWGKHYTWVDDGLARFSILVRIDLLLGSRKTRREQAGEGVSVSSCGSTYCWGRADVACAAAAQTFQYPRADRLIVGGCARRPPQTPADVSVSSCGSTYCWGATAPGCPGPRCRVSVSSCGSTYCWGHQHAALGNVCLQFQYPRADRLIVGAGMIQQKRPHWHVSVSSCGSTYCWGAENKDILVM